MPVARLASAEPLVVLHNTDAPSQLLSTLLLHAVECDASSQFSALQEAVCQFLSVPYCRISIVDTKRAKRLSDEERSVLRSDSWSSFSIDAALSKFVHRATNVAGGNSEEAELEEQFTDRVGIPLLTAKGVSIGSICIGTKPPHSLAAHPENSLAVFARIAVRELELQAHCLRDPVTGLASQFALEQFARGCAAAKVFPFLLLIGAKINGFDEHCELLKRDGANRLLSSVGSMFSKALRRSDLVSHVSGNRIVAACGLKASEDASICVRRIQSSITQISAFDGRPITLSLAIAEVEGGDLTSALNDLDAALYAARRLGTNKAVAASKLRQALAMFKSGSTSSPIEMLHSV
jgi:GGDEF domain-containing protein